MVSSYFRVTNNNSKLKIKKKMYKILEIRVMSRMNFKNLKIFNLFVFVSQKTSDWKIGVVDITLQNLV
jgi:hypothetical protein